MAEYAAAEAFPPGPPPPGLKRAARGAYTCLRRVSDAAIRGRVGREEAA